MRLARFQQRITECRSAAGEALANPKANVKHSMFLELAAWSMVANMILNLDETITKG